MNVTIFGGSAPRPGDQAYADAYHLGRFLGGNHHTVLTGGYIGTMEAASRGAVEAGGHTIGVTCEEIERWRDRKPNAWVKEEWRCQTLQERLQRLIEGCEAAIALPGGAGTLAEISLFWNRLIIGSLPARRLLLVGPVWEEVFTRLFDLNGMYFSPVDRRWLSFAADVDYAAAIISEISI